MATNLEIEFKYLLSKDDFYKVLNHFNLDFTKPL